MRLAITAFLPVMNIRKILCLICLFLQAIVIAIANEGERSAHVGSYIGEGVALPRRVTQSKIGLKDLPRGYRSRK